MIIINDNYVTTTYLRDINKYILYLYHDNQLSYSIVVKKVLDIKEPFILNEDGKDIKILDKDFYILEYIPYTENYICRIFLDNEKNVIERFYIITDQNEIINGVPVYKDYKLSYVCTPYGKKVYNFDKFDQLLKSNIISQAKYLTSKKILNKIIEEIKEDRNYIYNLNYKEFL